MAQARIIDNATRPAGDELLASLEWACDVRIATAHAAESGVSRIIEPLARLLSKGGEARVVYGLDFRSTDPEALEELTALADCYPGVTHYAYSDWRLPFSHAFHPNIYICADGVGSACAIVGSSSLTRFGLWDNTEANAVVTGAVDEPVIADALSVFNRIAASPALFVPDAEYAERYRDIYRKANALPLTSEPPAELAAAYEKLKRLEAQLPSGAIAGQGWAAEVLLCTQVLHREKGEFTLADFTQRFGERLARLHPQNRHVDAKIRQQFQLLRDRGALAFLGGGRYRMIDEGPGSSV